MKFELNKDQVEELNKWQAAIKEIYGEYGLYDYKFTPYGIGNGVSVYSHLAKKELDLTHSEDW